MSDSYAVIGHPIAHSQSPFIHGLFARACQQDMRYEALDGGRTVETFRQKIAAFRRDGGQGLNVTLPFKLAALEMAEHANPEARVAGAANTLKWTGRGLEAINTDGLGLVQDIRENLNFELQGRNLLLLGAGGAARGVMLPLRNAGVARLVVANRTPDKARELARWLASQTGERDLFFGGGFDLTHERTVYDVVINATSASIHGDLPPISSNCIGPDTLVYDMMYAAEPTPFLKWAKNTGVQHLADGLGMLVEQAAASFDWWRGMRPETGWVQEQVRQRMKAQA